MDHEVGQPVGWYRGFGQKAASGAETACQPRMSWSLIARKTSLHWPGCTLTLALSAGADDVPGADLAAHLIAQLP